MIIKIKDQAGMKNVKQVGISGEQLGDPQHDAGRQLGQISMRIRQERDPLRKYRLGSISQLEGFPHQEEQF